MLSCAVFGNSIFIATVTPAIPFPSTASASSRFIIRFSNRAFLKHSEPSSSVNKSSLHHDSLRVLEWDKLCDSVASFASTSLGRDATKAQLWSLNQTYEESMRLLEETNAALEIHKHGGCSLDFGAVDVVLVKSAIQHALRGLPMDGIEAMAVVALLQLAETLQFNLKAVIKEDSDWYKRFMPLSEVIMELVINRSLVKLIQQVVDEDGSVKDSASPTLKRSREQVRMLERKLYQLMESLIRNEMNETSSLEVSNIDGRWCIRSGADQLTNFQGLLLSRCTKYVA